jgi:hypothetical protein
MFAELDRDSFSFMLIDDLHFDFSFKEMSIPNRHFCDEVPQWKEDQLDDQCQFRFKNDNFSDQKSTLNANEVR